jgi:hypothetical protein
MNLASPLATPAWTRWTARAACCLLAAFLVTASPRALADDRGAYQGLWWAVPAGSEAGWGLNVAHQGDILFVTWFVYDSNRAPTWLSMTAAKVGEGRFEGTLYRTSGPSYTAVPFLPSAVGTTLVGTASLHFTSASDGAFSYAVGDFAATKSITRQVFGALPVCAFAALPELSLATNYQDLWWAAPAGVEAGWGVNFAHQGDTIFATWFTYGTDGSPLWLSATAAKVAARVYAGTLYRSTGPAFDAAAFDPALVGRSPVGTLRVAFDDGNHATFEATVGGTSLVKAITRQVFVPPGTACSDAAGTAFRGTVVLGIPTATSIKANVFALDQSGTVWIEFGAASGQYDHQTERRSLTAGVPVELTLDGLAADARHYYRLRYQTSGAAASAGDEYSFHTARAPGSTFTFTLQGDSHPERERSQFNADLYARTLVTAAADRPDFHLAIGDDFSVDTLDAASVTEAQVVERYVLQRPFLGLVGRFAPIFLVNGNHEQAARYLLDGTPDNVAVWAQNARNAHYSQPAPDGFYTGNPELVPYIGLLRNYFAWTWGDALFVVIDPYWGSSVCVDAPFGGGSKRINLWDVTLGEAQYQWFKATLEQSRAKYKFVLAHHVLGTGRGGIELAEKYEWGGQNANGTWGFASNRPGWAQPIHALMVAHDVTVFFQGHDHIWARQSLDGVTYQTLSEPADPNYSLFNADAYASGDKFPNTGYTRVNVSPSGVQVEYVRTYLPADEGTGRRSGDVAFRYTVR